MVTGRITSALPPVTGSNDPGSVPSGQVPDSQPGPGNLTAAVYRPLQDGSLKSDGDLKLALELGGRMRPGLLPYQDTGATGVPELILAGGDRGWELPSDVKDRLYLPLGLRPESGERKEYDAAMAFAGRALSGEMSKPWFGGMFSPSLDSLKNTGHRLAVLAVQAAKIADSSGTSPSDREEFKQAAAQLLTAAIYAYAGAQDRPASADQVAELIYRLYGNANGRASGPYAVAGFGEAFAMLADAKADNLLPPESKKLRDNIPSPKDLLDALGKRAQMDYPKKVLASFASGLFLGGGWPGDTKETEAMISAIARERYPALHQREAVQRYLERLEANPDLRRQLKNDPDLRFKELLQI